MRPLMRKRNWSASVALALTTGILLAGCSSGGDEAESPSTPAASSAAASAPDGESAQPEAGAEPTTLEFWTFAKGAASYEKLFDKLVADFQTANPNITINRTDYPFDQYFTRLTAAISAGEGPDVAAQFSDENWEGTLPLDDLLTPEEREQITLIDQSQPLSTDDKIHFMPYGSYVGLFMFNRDLFAKAGLDPDAPPATLDEFLAACDALKASGVVPMQYGFKDQYTAMRLVAPMASQLMTTDDLNAWNALEIPYTDPRYKQAFEALNAMVERGCFGERPETEDSSTSGPAFRAQESAMYYADGAIDPTDWENDIGAGNLGVFAVPAIAEGLTPNADVSANGGLQIMEWVDPEKIDEAWEFVSFAVSPEGQTIAWETSKQLPNHTSVQIGDATGVFDTLLSIASDPSSKVGIWPVPVSGKEAETYGALAPEVFAGRLSVDDFLSLVQEVRDKESANSGG